MCSLLSLRTGSAGANIRFFPDDGRLSVSWELGRREWFNEAETSSPLAGFGLTPSSSGRTTPFAWIAPDRIASRASLLPPADAQLDVERTILIIDTFQPIRTTSHCWCYQEETEQTEAGLEFSTLSEANTDSPLGEPRKLHIKDSLPSPEILCSLGFLLCNFIKTAE